ncbi:MAG: hypothetical protein ACKOIA_02190 [Acidimicrobiia bacterium]
MCSTASAPKVLVDGARWLARSTTYQFAAFGMRASGASGAVNAAADAKAEAIAAAVAELSGEAWSNVHLTAGRGISAADVSALRDHDPRPGDWFAQRDAALVAGLVAAAERAAGGLAGTTVAVEQFDAATGALVAALAEAGATVAEIDEDLGRRSNDAERSRRIVEVDDYESIGGGEFAGAHSSESRTVHRANVRRRRTPDRETRAR